MIELLPDWAESCFRSACLAGGIICHPPDKDRHGWDYYLEFSRHLSPTQPADTQPPMQTAFVQIKSSESRKLSCRVKLSNALKAAESDKPWFIVLIHAGEGTQSPIIYAIHVWQDQIRASLKAIRLAENESASLNQKSLTVSFCESDNHTHDVASWMRQCISGIGSDYGRAKREIYHGVGYESGSSKLKVTITAKSQDEIFDHFLGLGGRLTLTFASFQPERFGIPELKGKIEAEGGFLEIKPEPVGSCEIRIRGESANESVVMPAKVYALGIPGLPHEKQRYRFSGECLEIIHRGSGETRCNAKLDVNGKVSLATIERFLLITSWAKAGKVDLQIWNGPHRLVAGSLKMDEPNDAGFAAAGLRFVKRLRKLSGSSAETDPKVSLFELADAAPKYRLLGEMIDGESLDFQFEPISEMPENFTSAMYYLSVEVGDWRFNAVVRRDITEDTFIDGRRRFVCGPPIILESYASLKESDHPCPIEEDFNRHYNDLVAKRTVIGLGDIIALNQLAEKERLEELSRSQEKP